MSASGLVPALREPGRRDDPAGRRTRRRRRKRRFSRAFEQFLELVDAFVALHGHASPLYSDRVGNFPIGHRATYYRQRFRKHWLTPEQVRVLEDGTRFPKWSWKPLDGRFAEGIRHLEAYRARTGDCMVPPSHVEDGFPLGRWTSHRRHEHRAGSLAPDREAVLASVSGWCWEPSEIPFPRALSYLRAYVEREGHARVTTGHIEDGFPLGSWVSHRRKDRRDGRLEARRARVLESLGGWVWDARDQAFDAAYLKLVGFVARTKHARVPQKHREGAFALGAWVARVRRRHRIKGRLTEHQVARLERLPGWTWGRGRGAGAQGVLPPAPSPRASEDRLSTHAPANG